MKCINNNNTCNPKKPEKEIGRNYNRQPFKESEYPECPFRVDGKCTNDAQTVKLITHYRRIITDRRKQAELDKITVILPNYSSEITDIIVAVFPDVKIVSSGTFSRHAISAGLSELCGKNPTAEFIFRMLSKNPLSVKRFINFNTINYNALLEQFDEVTATEKKTTVTGKLANFDVDVSGWMKIDTSRKVYFEKELEHEGKKLIISLYKEVV